MNNKVLIILFFTVIFWNIEKGSNGIYAQSTYKTTTDKVIFSLDYSEHNDGCLVYYKQGYYHYRTESQRKAVGGVSHRNDNAIISADINLFNSEIKRLYAVPDNDQQEIFDSTPIGSWYFVYRITQQYGKYNYPSVSLNRNEGIPISETFVVYHCRIWRVDVIAGR